MRWLSTLPENEPQATDPESGVIDRRGFIKTASAGLVLAMYLPLAGKASAAAAPVPAGALAPNAFVRVSPDNWVFLDLSRKMCSGVCRLPHSAHYFLPIGALDSGSCGVFTGADCQPVTTSTVGGTVMVKVSWSQGNQNGLENFQVEIGRAHV